MVGRDTTVKGSLSVVALADLVSFPGNCRTVALIDPDVCDSTHWKQFSLQSVCFINNSKDQNFNVAIKDNLSLSTEALKNN